MWACPSGKAPSGRAFRSVAAAEKSRQATRLQSLTQKQKISRLPVKDDWQQAGKSIWARTRQSGELSSFSGQQFFKSKTPVLCAVRLNKCRKRLEIPIKFQQL